MTSLRLLLPSFLAVCIAFSSPAQSQRESEPSRTGKKAAANPPAKAESKGTKRKPQSGYEPLPHEPPMTRPVDINYPPAIYIPVSSRPHPAYVSEPEPASSNPQRSGPGRQRKIVTVALDDCVENSEGAGYSFAREQIVACEDSSVDLYLSTTGPDSAYFLVPPDNDIKDLGRHESIRDVVRFKPRDWSEDHAVLLTAGHVYVVWTYDGDFVLVRVVERGARHVTFDWIRHSRLSRATAAEAEMRQREKDEVEASRRENLGPYFTK